MPLGMSFHNLDLVHVLLRHDGGRAGGGEEKRRGEFHG
jgi:hypothetical protein